MELNTSTLYNIGDKVWVYRFISEGPDFHSWHYGIEEREIELIRVIYTGREKYIQYFLKGLQSYEGENWFDEESPNPKQTFMDDGLFQTKEEARAYMDFCNKKCEEDE